MKTSKAEEWLVTKIAGVDLFSFSASGFMTLAPTILVITGPIIFPQRFPILTLNERNGRVNSINTMHVKDQKLSQMNPIVNRIIKEK
jgi:hypothetical protein